MKIPMATSLQWQRCTTVQPASLAKSPDTWTKDEVGVWLRWCTVEYSIDPIPLDRFDLNGKALCLLSRNDFMERVPKNGDVLYNSLKSLVSKQGGKLLYQTGIATGSEWYSPSPFKDPQKSTSSSGFISDQSSARYLVMPSSSPLSASTVAKPPSNVPCRPICSTYVPIQPHPYLSVFTKHEEDHELPSVAGPTSAHIGSSAFVRPSSAPEDLRSEHMSLDVLRQDRSSDCRLLWEFIYQLLCNHKYSTILCWEDKDDYVFRIINPTGLAELWGQQKNRTNMTYEKLSRALRYYYRMNIIKKVPGKRLTYRFLQPPMTIQKGQRGAKPHYKLHLDSVNDPSVRNVSRADRDSPFASYSGCSPCVASPKDDSSNTSTCEANLDDIEEDDGYEHESVCTSHSPELETWIERSKGQSNVSQETFETSSDNERKIPPTTLTHTSSIDSYPRSTHLENNMINTSYQSHADLSADFHKSRQGPDTFFLTASTSHIGNNHPFTYQGHATSAFTSNAYFDNEVNEKMEKVDSAEHYLHENVKLGKSLSRSHSFDFAQSFQTRPYSFRPTSVHSSSIKSDLQVEPEDLSLKGRPRPDLESLAIPSASKQLKEKQHSPDSS